MCFYLTKYVCRLEFTLCVVSSIHVRYYNLNIFARWRAFRIFPMSMLWQKWWWKEINWFPNDNAHVDIMHNKFINSWHLSQNWVPSRMMLKKVDLPPIPSFSFNETRCSETVFIFKWNYNWDIVISEFRVFSIYLCIEPSWYFFWWLHCHYRLLIVYIFH